MPEELAVGVCFPSGAKRSADAEGCAYWLVSPLAVAAMLAEEHRLPPCEAEALRQIYQFLEGPQEQESLLVAARYVAEADLVGRGGTPSAIDTFVHVLTMTGRALHEGAHKYGWYNWERGMPVYDLLNHAIRHILLAMQGNDDEPHHDHAAWNLVAAFHSYVLWPHLQVGTLRSGKCKPPDGLDMLAIPTGP